ncbi:MAG: hypothetical protein CVT78_13745 [Alphaproteobacteria bacterium HGW-Alphaproteobacteria-17]|nr:MAG: hypothetical protein CVT78_13745 [Alphaproteobacteria bacterium HGW-Alphaproteobacteria-17]
MIEPTTLIKIAFVTILLLAAYSDARRYLIPNVYSAAVVLLFIAAKLTGFDFPEPLWTHLLHFGIALGVGLALFYFRWFGGGDVKLYAAIALWFGMSQALLLLLITTVTGALIVVARMIWFALATWFGRDSAPGAQKARMFERRIAYGIAIAAGGISSLFIVYP